MTDETVVEFNNADLVPEGDIFAEVFLDCPDMQICIWACKCNLILSMKSELRKDLMGDFNAPLGW